jgi:[1-hydroxy-2-(trimethylamino)ethyl]phosphonate dioxygenase
MSQSVIDEIFRVFQERGDGAYLGEPVSQSEHALQAAAAAERDGAPPQLVAAALLHDYGHLVHDLAEDSAEHGVDTVHEDVGADWLGRHFVPAVTEPLRLHVAAKRYLCAVEPEYLDALSPASTLSLDLQGGPFPPDEVQAFEDEPHHREAVRLRRWDDEAKIEGLETPPFEHYRAALVSGLRTR